MSATATKTIYAVMGSYPTMSVPGNWIESRHATLVEAEAAKEKLEKIESIRRAKPQMSRAERDAAIKESYGYMLDGEPLQSAREKFTKKNRAYRIEAIQE